MYISAYGIGYHLNTAIKTFSLSDEYDANGTRRILQVLHAHTWPNLVMKGRCLLLMYVYLYM